LENPDKKPKKADPKMELEAKMKAFKPVFN